MRKIIKMFSTPFLIIYLIVFAFNVYFIIKWIEDGKPILAMINSFGAGISIGALFTYILLEKD